MSYIISYINTNSFIFSSLLQATSEIQSCDLPLGIKRFFACDVLHAGSARQEHTIPRFSVHTEGTFDHKLIINSSAMKLSTDLVQNFVQLLHQRTHHNSSQDKTNKLNSTNELSTGFIEEKACSEQTAFSPMASCRGDQSRQDLDSNLSSLISGHQKSDVHLFNHEDSFQRMVPGKASMSNSTLAIVAFGYQILRYPQFAELCWVTSKLREGPCTDVNGPWKGWPFNSCLIHDSNPPGGNSSIQSVKSRMVRGLIAVGLLSYRGVYTSVKEVASDVRKVLELLVGQVRAKITVRKDRYQYLRILSQVAYLEDMVNSWAYKFQR